MNCLAFTCTARRWVLGVCILTYGAAADAQQNIAKYEAIFQGVDNRTKVAFDEMSARLPKAEAETVLSRLPFGRTIHLKVPVLPGFTPLQPGQDAKVVNLVNLPTKSLERVIDPEHPNFLPAFFLEVGVRRQKAVCRIRLKAPHDVDGATMPAGSGWGSGFLISDSLLLTNNHVIEDKPFAKDKAVAQFNFQVGLDGALLPIDEFDLDPAKFFYTSPDLDFTIVRIKPKIAPNVAAGATAPPPLIPGTTWGHISLTTSVHFAEKQPVNIIQHPAARYKEVVLQDNEITEISADVIRYTADTEPGSSGSPVFDNQWTLVALHHSAGKQENGKWVSNEGIRGDRIVADIRAHAGTVVSELGLQSP